MGRKMKYTRRQLFRKTIVRENKGTCWDGYERVPGTKQYEKGSCRKKEVHEYMNDKILGEIDEMEEGNAFIDAASKAASRGQKSFTVDGETYPTRMSKTKGLEIQSEAALRRYIRNFLLEAIYDGRSVELNKPMSNPENPKKKSKVYVNSGEKYKSGEHKGQVRAKKVQFGDPNMKIKKSNPKRRKSFRARHNCANPGPKDKARYWSCKAW